jgi:hypothetical protein
VAQPGIYGIDSSASAQQSQFEATGDPFPVKTAPDSPSRTQQKETANIRSLCDLPFAAWKASHPRLPIAAIVCVLLIIASKVLSCCGSRLGSLPACSTLLLEASSDADEKQAGSDIAVLRPASP